MEEYQIKGCNTLQVVSIVSNVGVEEYKIKGCETFIRILRIIYYESFNSSRVI